MIEIHQAEALGLVIRLDRRSRFEVLVNLAESAPEQIIAAIGEIE